jgi:hypothetical protein
MSFTIYSGKEGNSPKRPLFLVSIVAPDGDVCLLTTVPYIGTTDIVYNSSTYLARIQSNTFQPIQAMSPQGYDTVPGFSMTINDGDKFIWTNHCLQHGWRGSAVTLTVILWDVVANQYSTDSLNWTFIGGNPGYDHSSGTVNFSTSSSTNFTRLKLPSIAIQYRCPWDFPTTYLQRLDGLINPSSLFYQCGYSADVNAGVGNLIASTTLSGAIATTGATSCTVASATGFPAVPFQAVVGSEELLVTLVAGTTLTIARGRHLTTPATHGSGSPFLVPYTKCELVRSSADLSVGCMARLGNHSTTSVAPDGDIDHDIAGHLTGRYGGVTWIAPSQGFTGKQFVSGNRVFGFNSPNTAIAGDYYNMVYGTQWVDCAVLAPAGDPNSNRSECVPCSALYGPAQVQVVLVNGVTIPKDNSDVLNTWRYINPGGRAGHLNGDAIYDQHGDPHGSVCCFEFVVPQEIAAAGSVPEVKALVSGPPILNVYAIATATASGGAITVTFTGPNWAAFPGLNQYTGASVSLIIVGSTWAGLNNVWTVTAATTGPPGTVTLNGGPFTGSGTGGAAFFYSTPSLSDTGGNLVSNPSVQTQNVSGPAANLAYVVMDLMTWGNITIDQFDAPSWYAAAQVCATPVAYIAANGSTQTHAQFKCSFALNGLQRQTLAQVITAVRNAGNLMVAPNSITGLIQAFVKQTLHDQQPAAISGSNYSTPVSSLTAANTVANGFYAYLFDETNIDKDSFRVSVTNIESTPNTVNFAFQDEQNGFQQDSITEIDPIAYQYSGNQEIAVPVPILGVPNFDQATRVSNVQLAEALFGNFRNDAGGTLYFEFKTNHRVLHLASRIGLICGLTWQTLGVGVSAPQSVRILSVQPDTDGESWNVKAAWHQDQWYTYAYGQNPGAFHRNPLLFAPDRPPYPWRPGETTWSPNDVLYPNQSSFHLVVDPSSYPTQVKVGGFVPVNAQQITLAPLLPLQCATAPTGGSIKPGTYFISLSPNGASGPASLFSSCVVPVGTNTNTITLSGVQWRDNVAAPNVTLFAGASAMQMSSITNIGNWTSSTPDAFGNDTMFVINKIPSIIGLGLPDVNFNKFLVEETDIFHGGVFGDAVATATLVTITAGVFGTKLTMPHGTGWGVNQWAGYTLSLYYRPIPTLGDQPGINAPVVSNDATSITVLGTLVFNPGDIVVMRAQASIVSANTIGDPNFVNALEPAGFNVNEEAGRQILIIAGTGVGYPAKTVASNTNTTFTINGSWEVMPDITTVFIVLSPTITYSYATKPFDSPDPTVSAYSEIATTKAVTTLEQQFLIRVSTADVNGKTAPSQYQPFREVYIPVQNLLGPGSGIQF